MWGGVCEPEIEIDRCLDIDEGEDEAKRPPPLVLESRISWKGGFSVAASDDAFCREGDREVGEEGALPKAVANDMVGCLFSVPRGESRDS